MSNCAGPVLGLQEHHETIEHETPGAWSRDPRTPVEKANKQKTNRGLHFVSNNTNSPGNGQ
eukprot:309619-Pyramimonas_sp.AAC.1